MSKSPATPQKPGLLLHTQKAFPGKYEHLYGVKPVFKVCDLSYDDS
ncbi:MAG: hypothetical protein KDD15_08225 [Lewinella sp.]|nr:hypothetical protein [Lewinella sp.]